MVQFRGGGGRKSKKIVRVNADFIVIVLYLRSFSSDSYGNNKYDYCVKTDYQCNRGIELIEEQSWNCYNN